EVVLKAKAQEGFETLKSDCDQVLS
ncbi:hypothetical protein A2U01_0082465, partial [Trifolium medium]|nr:hypothetical protein [Trifolium medium]